MRHISKEEDKEKKQIFHDEKLESVKLKDFFLERIKCGLDLYFSHYIVGLHYQKKGDCDNAIYHFEKSITDNSSEEGCWIAYWNTLHAKDNKTAVSKYSSFLNKTNIVRELTDDMVLFRISKTEYLKPIITSGTLRFASSKSYRKPESEGPWYDLNENKPQNVFNIENVSLPGVDIKSMSLNLGGLYHIMCFSIMTPINKADFIKKYHFEKFLMEEGGYSALVIHKPKTFIDELKKEIPALEYGLITYLPNEVIEHADSVLNPFLKRERFSEEFEFRLANQNISSKKMMDEPVFVNSESIKKYAEIVSVGQLVKKINADYTPLARAQCY